MKIFKHRCDRGRGNDATVEQIETAEQASYGAEAKVDLALELPFCGNFCFLTIVSVACGLSRDRLVGCLSSTRSVVVDSIPDRCCI